MITNEITSELDEIRFGEDTYRLDDSDIPYLLLLLIAELRNIDKTLMRD